MPLFANLSAFSVFIAIAAVGFLFLVVALVFGEIFDSFGADLDHDLDHGGPGIFSGRVIAVFITAFGGFGAIGTYYGLSPLPASAVGFAGGLVFGGAIYVFARFLYQQQSSSEVRAADLVGQVARVVVAIPPGGVGQVRLRVGEELIDKIARTRAGDSVPENVSVQVEEVLGETVIVKKH